MVGKWRWGDVDQGSIYIYIYRGNKTHYYYLTIGNALKAKRQICFSSGEAEKRVHIRYIYIYISDVTYTWKRSCREREKCSVMLQICSTLKTHRPFRSPKNILPRFSFLAFCCARELPFRRVSSWKRWIGGFTGFCSTLFIYFFLSLSTFPPKTYLKNWRLLIHEL